MVEVNVLCLVPKKLITVLKQQEIAEKKLLLPGRFQFNQFKAKGRKE